MCLREEDLIKEILIGTFLLKMGPKKEAQPEVVLPGINLVEQAIPLGVVQEKTNRLLLAKKILLPLENIQRVNRQGKASIKINY